MLSATRLYKHMLYGLSVRVKGKKDGSTGMRLWDDEHEKCYTQLNMNNLIGQKWNIFARTDFSAQQTEGI